MQKILVAYFSASGVTKRAAEEIAAAVGADLCPIEPVQPYTDADLDWRNRQSRSSVEMNDAACRPAFRAPAADVAAYDTVFIGFPVWWYVEPRIVDSFLEAYKFAGKTLIPFATSGGSSIAGAEKSLRAHCPAARWKSGKLVNGGAAAWAKSAVKE